MSEYLILSVFSIFTFFSIVEYYFLFRDDKGVSSIRLAVFLVAFFAFLLFSGFREVGFSSDDDIYLEIFNNIRLSGEWASSSTNEPIFIAMNRLVASLSNDVSLLFLLFAVLTAFFTCSAFFTSSRLMSLSILIYFSHVYLYRDMIQIRAGLSYSISMLLLALYIRGKARLFYPAAIVPGLVHSSGFLTLIIPSLNRFEYTVKKSVCLILMSLVVGSVGISNILMELLNELNFGGLQSAVNTYLLVRNEFNREVGLLNPTTIKQIFWIFIFNYNYCRIKEAPYSGLLLWMYTISTCILLVFNEFSTFSARLASFFTISEFFLIPILIAYSKSRSVMFFFIAILYCSSVFLLNIFMKGLFSGYQFNFWHSL